MDSDTVQQMAESCVAMMDRMTEMMQMHEQMPMDQGQGARGTMAAMTSFIDPAIATAGGWWLVLSIGLVLAIVASVLLVRRRSADDPASFVLGRRYATGEIGREEYLSMRADLAEREVSQRDGRV